MERRQTPTVSKNGNFVNRPNPTNTPKTINDNTLCIRSLSFFYTDTQRPAQLCNDLRYRYRADVGIAYYTIIYARILSYYYNINTTFQNTHFIFLFFVFFFIDIRVFRVYNNVYYYIIFLLVINKSGSDKQQRKV